MRRQPSDRFKCISSGKFHECDTKDRASVVINLDILSFISSALDTVARLDGVKLDPWSSSASPSVSHDVLCVA